MLKKDYEVNESVISKLIITIYRFGNFVYYKCKIPLLKQCLWFFYRISDFFIRLSLHCEIPATVVIGEGFRLDHNGSGVVIHPKAIIGEGCRIFHQVTIGIDSFSDEEEYGVAIIGDHCYIGAGAKIIGKVNIGSNVRIGANAVVIKDIPDNCTSVGVPSKNLIRKK